MTPRAQRLSRQQAANHPKGPGHAAWISVTEHLIQLSRERDK